MDHFVTALYATACVLASIAGSAAAVLLFVAAIILVIIVAGALFDSITDHMAKCWARKGIKPRGRLGRIIMQSHGEDTDGKL